MDGEQSGENLAFRSCPASHQVGGSVQTSSGFSFHGLSGELEKPADFQQKVTKL